MVQEDQWDFDLGYGIWDMGFERQNTNIRQQKSESPTGGVAAQPLVAEAASWGEKEIMALRTGRTSHVKLEKIKKQK
jgi:hypothetical protein